MADAVHDANRLKELQALPLSRKIQISQTRIIEWYKHYNGNVYVSFSGGKDSTVLLNIVRSIYPEVKAVFSNTGLEYPEVQRHVKTFDNIEIVTPKMRFDAVVKTFGYPLIGKDVASCIYYSRKIRTKELKCDNKYGKRLDLLGLRTLKSGEKSCFNKDKWMPLSQLPFLISSNCCYKMKKSPIRQFQNKHGLYPILGTLAEESVIRKNAWIHHGCNAFDGSHPSSQPLSFWTEQDILQYIVKYDIQIPSVYGDIVSVKDGINYPPIDVIGEIGCNLKCTGCDRTGCIFCGFGFHLDKGETRFQRLAKTHPKQYEYSIYGGEWADNPRYDPVAPEYDGMWKNWNPKKIWVPSKKGLGMGKVFDMVNEIYGKNFYKYE